MNFLFGNNRNKTFKPKKRIPEGSRQAELLKRATATLGSGNLRDAVKLPMGEDQNEWIAVNKRCPMMSAGRKYEYLWRAEGCTVTKPIKCSAPMYIDYLMTWVQDQLDDEAVFPSKIGVKFPSNFLDVAKTIMKRLFRVYAHIYYQHFQDVEQLKEEAHLNTSFKHFILFVDEFRLIEHKELQPLQELIDKFTSKDSQQLS